jgi:Chaperone of endosialidase
MASLNIGAISCNTLSADNNIVVTTGATGTSADGNMYPRVDIYPTHVTLVDDLGQSVELSTQGPSRVQFVSNGGGPTSIGNVGYPDEQTDAVPRNYLEDFINQGQLSRIDTDNTFFPNSTNVYHNPTPATSTTIAAMSIVGGIGIGKNLIVGESIKAQCFIASSDYNLKENIAPICDALDVLRDISPVKFTWKSSGVQSYGVIAQELSNVLPSVVHTCDGVLAVEYNSLIAVTMAACKELQQQLTELRLEVDSLRKHVVVER